jgi:hypothetical protein
VLFQGIVRNENGELLVQKSGFHRVHRPDSNNDNNQGMK